MTDEERAIWQAAYAAAFVADYERTRKAAESIPSHLRAGRLPSETALDRTTAEGPGYIANLAVTRLREWRSKEKPSWGISIEPPRS